MMTDNMRFAKKILLPLLGLMLVATQMACSKQMDGDVTPASSGDMYGIELNLAIDNSELTSISLRATEVGDLDQSVYGSDPLNENKVKTIDLLFFNGDQLVGHFDNNKVQELSVEGNIHKVRVSVRNKTDYAGKNLTVVAIVNTTVDLSGITSLSLLKSTVQEDQISLLNPFPATPQTSFLMDGQGSSGTIKWDVTNTVYTVPTNIELRRAAAKIRVRVDNIEISDFQNGIETKYIIVGEPQIAIFRGVRNTSLLSGNAVPVAKQQWANSEYRPMAQKSFPQISEITAGDYWTALPFYVYENDWSNAGELVNQDSSTGTTSASSKETYVQIKLSLYPVGKTPADAKEYFYVLPVNYRDIADGKQVKRNHLYDIFTTINQLGSLDEKLPLELESNIAIEPWPEPTVIDGSALEANYLVVMEQDVIMPNITTRKIMFRSNKPVIVTKISETFIYYDEYGILQTVDANEATLSTGTEYINGTVTVNAPIPLNYLPRTIEFKIKQEDKNAVAPLETTVKVTQYPPMYVTGKKSPGLYSKDPQTTTKDTSGNTIHADFRQHTPFGNAANGVNDVFFRVTNIAPRPGTILGDPVGDDGRTKTDEQSNKIVSPEFIFASQYGMSPPLPQSNGEEAVLNRIDSESFISGYGPFSSLYPSVHPYLNYNGVYSGPYGTTLWQIGTSAEDRCYNYFEGDYGTDGTYKEVYIATDKKPYSRQVKKTFKYKGRWRLPTLAELAIIDKMQDDSNSKIKSLLTGADYWSGRTDYTHRLANNAPYLFGGSNATYVRCVFDTWKLPNRAPY